MRRRIGWRGVLALMLMALGFAGVSEAALIHAKARLGQWLIADAWERMKMGERTARPWPWADLWPVARIEVPAHGVDVIVLAGATGPSLAWGPGHLAGTAPVGASGNAVVGGHRDTHFAFLRDLEHGDRIRAEGVNGEQRAYRVVDRFVTDERDDSVLLGADEDRLTLITCWPFDTPVPGGPLRFVVVAEAEGKGVARERSEVHR